MPICQVCGCTDGIEKKVITGGVKKFVCICFRCEINKLQNLGQGNNLKINNTNSLQNTKLSKVSDTNVAMRRQLTVCNSCGRTSLEYEQSGLLGCPDCYVSFANCLVEDLQRFQISTVHVGKSPNDYFRKGINQKNTALSDYDRLREELDTAITQERFSDAAVIKCMIDNLKGRQ